MLRAVFAEAPLPMFLLERDGTVRRVNNHACDVTGSRPAYASGKAFTVFVDLPFRAAVQTYLAAAVRTGLAQRTECALLGQDGVVRVQSTIEPITLPKDAGRSLPGRRQPAPRARTQRGPHRPRYRHHPHTRGHTSHPHPGSHTHHLHHLDHRSNGSHHHLDPGGHTSHLRPVDLSSHSGHASTKNHPRHSCHSRSGGHFGHDQAGPAAPAAPGGRRRPSQRASLPPRHRPRSASPPPRPCRPCGRWRSGWTC